MALLRDVILYYQPLNANFTNKLMLNLNSATFSFVCSFFAVLQFTKKQWTTRSFNFHQMAVHKRTTMIAHCNLKQNTWLCSKQSSFFSFYALSLAANRKTRWSIEVYIVDPLPSSNSFHFFFKFSEVISKNLKLNLKSIRI